MRICHIALGGCLTAPHVQYGITEDTGGHIAYILGAAFAQAASPAVDHVEIVTRAFNEPTLDPIHGTRDQIVSAKLSIRRLEGTEEGYLSKEALAAEVPVLTQRFLSYLDASRNRPDVIHAHFADAASVALAARERFGIPVVYTPHSLGLSKIGGTPSQARIADERRALENSDATIVSSRDESDVQVTAYGVGLQARVHRIRPGVTVDCSDGTHGSEAVLRAALTDPDRPMILAIARPVRRKNLSGLARVYAASKALQEKANLVILAGQHAAARDNAELQDELSAIRQIVRQPHLRGKVAFPAAHDAQTVKALYAKAAASHGVFANLAHHEPFGLTLLEAAAHGLPVIATDAGGPRDIVDDLRCGRCVPATDENAVESAILSLLDNPQAWNDASRAGRRGVSKYSWTTYAKSSIKLYGEVTRPKRYPAPMLLASDIDNTLTGCANGVAEMNAWFETHRPHFAVVTGRSISEARHILQQWHLPEPDVFVTSVGSEIYLRDAHGRLALDWGYARRLDVDWDPSAIEGALQKLGIPLQPAVEQRRWKVSGFGAEDLAQELHRYLQKRSISARVVASHGRLIDVLPKSGGKANAVREIMQKLRIEPRNTLVAGDSGNDLDMLLRVGQLGGAAHGVIVANAQDGLKSRLSGSQVYVAQTPHASGVLEGLMASGLANTPAPILEIAE